MRNSTQNRFDKNRKYMHINIEFFSPYMYIMNKLTDIVTVTFLSFLGIPHFNYV